MKFLGIAGSLRVQSLNLRLLEQAGALLPQDVEFSAHPLRGIELYDEEVRARGVPAAVSALGQAIASADAVLIATPEYNYSIPGVLKNAIDWVSRLDPQPFDDKPVAIMGASPGRLGTARAQYHLRQVFVFLNARLLNRPEIMLSAAATAFDDDGRLISEDTCTLLGRQMQALADLANRMGH